MQQTLLAPALPRRDGRTPGSVIKVEVTDFMTYRHAVFYPGARLNLVLGPNGTGKSSLVCAICLGLGGKPSLLGRAEDVSSFVRQGTTTGWVAVTVCGENQRDITFKRIMRIKDNVSDWQINGRDTRQRDVLAKVESLNIQLENLCQFLPQDKVVEFARLDPPALLRATQASIGSNDLTAAHDSLIHNREERVRLDKAIWALNESVVNLRQQNERIEPAVQALRQRKRLQEEIRLGKSKLAWAAHKDIQERYDAAAERLAEVKTALEEVNRQLADEDNVSKRLKTSRTTAKNERDKVAAEVKKAEQRLNSAGWERGQAERLEELLTETHNLEQQLAQIKPEEERRLTEIARLEEEIVGLEELQDQGGHEAEVKRLEAEVQRLSVPLAELQSQSRDLDAGLNEVERQQQDVERSKQEVHDRLRRLALESSQERQLRTLDSKTRGIGQAARWVAQNTAEFARPVYGPIGAVIEVKDREHAAALTCHIPGRLFNFFVVACREDQDRLQQELHRRFGFQASVACYTGYVSESQDMPRRVNLDKLKQYHITHTLDQVFEAPKIVKQYLEDECSITQTVLGGQRSQEYIDQIFEAEPHIGSIFTPGTSYRLYKSTYNKNAKSCSIKQIPDPSVLHPKPAHLEEEEQRLEQEMQRQIAKEKDLGRESADMNERLVQVYKEKESVEKEHTDAKAQLNAAGARVHLASYEIIMKQKEIEELRRRPSVAECESEIKSKINANLRLAQGQIDMIVGAYIELGVARRRLSMLELECKAVDYRIRSATENKSKNKKMLDKATSDLSGAKMVFNQCKSELRAKKELLTQCTEGDEEKYDSLPDDTEELQERITSMETEMEGLVITNPGALEQYESRTETIKVQERKLEQQKAQLAEVEKQIASVRDRWLSRLRQIVDTVNGSFQRNFAQVGCAGEVVLKEAEDEDYERYAIEIRVKFRESQELQTLDAHRQSGGERSVSTILYLIALQGVSVAPFRVVDEINQGMDPINERKVYAQLVDAASRPGTPQCFLLTPKLLPNLPFNEAVTILQIMNGPYIGEVANCFSSASLLGEQRMSLLVPPSYA